MWKHQAVYLSPSLRSPVSIGESLQLHMQRWVSTHLFAKIGVISNHLLVTPRPQAIILRNASANPLTKFATGSVATIALALLGPIASVMFPMRSGGHAQQDSRHAAF